MLVPSMARYEPQAASLSHMGSHMLFNYSSVQSSVLEAARGAAQCYIVSLWFEPVSEEGQDTCRRIEVRASGHHEAQERAERAARARWPSLTRRHWCSSSEQQHWTEG